MADDDAKTTGTTTATKTSGLNIPAEVRAKFPKIIELIEISQSMNKDERQYWVDVLPIMSEDQIQNLLDILENEKKQIKEANTKYEKGMESEINEKKAKFDEYKYKEQKRIRQEAETMEEKKESEHEDDLLKEIENM